MYNYYYYYYYYYYYDCYYYYYYYYYYFYYYYYYHNVRWKRTLTGNIVQTVSNKNKTFEKSLA